MSGFKYIYAMEPIDFWSGATVVDLDDDNCVKVYQDMDALEEVPRDGNVYKLMIPSPVQLEEIYLCKADNNGTVYIFTDTDLSDWGRITDVRSGKQLWEARRL